MQRKSIVLEGRRRALGKLILSFSGKTSKPAFIRLQDNHCPRFDNKPHLFHK